MPKAKIYTLEKPKRPIATVDADILKQYLGGSKGRFFRGGNSVVDKYLKNEEHTDSWMYVKPLKNISNEAFDPLWTSSTAKGPCLSKAISFDDKPKCGRKSTKTVIDKANPDAPPKIISGQELKWNRSWLLIFNTAHCRENDPEFYQLIHDSFLPTFAYHCQGGVRAEYIYGQFEESTHIAMLISDCVENVPETASRSSAMSSPKTHFKRPRPPNASLLTIAESPSEDEPKTSSRSARSARSTQEGGNNECGYIIMGFMFLDSIHDVPMMNRWARDRMLYQQNRPRPEKLLYIDIVCSRLSMANIMMKEILSGGNGPWMDIVFGKRSLSYIVFLRAIPNVYTYYPIVYDYVRTVNNASFAPIFEVDMERIRLSQLQIPNVPMPILASNEELMTGMFGPQKNRDGFTIWKKSKMKDEVQTYYVYKLERACKDFFVLNNLIENTNLRRNIFPATEAFEDDYDDYGYIYGKYVESK